MTTAGATLRQAQGDSLGKARIRRLGEAHVLAAAIFRHYEKSGELESAAWSTQPVNPPTDQLSTTGGPASGGPVMRRLLGDFQKALILDTARALGVVVKSRKDLTAEQLSRICTALCARMDELGIPEPEQNRPPERATADQYRRLYKVIDKVERLAGWGGRAHTLNFIHRQSGRRSLRSLARSQAEAIERGLDGILRHSMNPSLRQGSGSPLRSDDSQTGSGPRSDRGEA